MSNPAAAPKGDFGERRSRLLQALAARKLPSLLVTDLFDIAYLTGFRGSAGVAWFTPSQAILWVDPRYTLQARQDGWRVEVLEARHGLLQVAGKWLNKHAQGAVGYHDGALSAQSYFALREGLGRRARLIPAGDLVADLRVTKGEEEIAPMREAGRVTAEVFAEILPLIHPGATESDLAAEFDYRARQKGAEGMAFETIVASGAHAAFPHARPSRKLLEKCDLVIIDGGVIISGYAADMTRTYYLGKPGRRVRSLYRAVLGAQQRGIQALAEGVRAQDVDAAARRALDEKGLGKFFTHSTGHGIGMEVHEAPRVAKRSKTRLSRGCVVTIEPGVYLEGFGGVRIEDTILLGAGGPESLTPACKTDWILA